jgi:membrane carboxypeptidase/penicillin-binding protein PbpC
LSDFKNELQIIYPLNNDKFILDKTSQNQFTTFQAVSKKPVEFIIWFINGMEYTRTKLPYKTYWQLQKGVHLISAVDSFNNADEVKITVK